jgi:hypothetical protein
MLETDFCVKIRFVPTYGNGVERRIGTGTTFCRIENEGWETRVAIDMMQ